MKLLKMKNNILNGPFTSVFHYFVVNCAYYAQLIKQIPDTIDIGKY